MGVFVSIRHGRPRPRGVPVFGEHRDYFSGENEGWAGVVASFPSEERMGAVGAPAREAAHWGLDGSFRGSMAPADY